MRAVITGGAGFIGSHVAERFAQQGYELCILDNLSTGSRANLHPSWQLFEADVCDFAAVSHIVKGANVVVHLAAFTSVPESFKRFCECYRTNVEGTYHVLEACARHAVRKCVIASSSAIYAGMPDTPKSESECPDPLSPYAVSKLEGEHLLQAFGRFHGLKGTALRFFNVYGPRQLADSDYAAVIPIFIERSLRGRAFTIYDDGRQTRDFVFIRDVAEVVFKAAVSETTGVYNVGTGEPTEVLTIADKVSDLSGQRLGYVFEPSRPGDIRSSTADILKVRSALDWSPSVSLQQGLEETYQWYREIFKKLESV